MIRRTPLLEAFEARMRAEPVDVELNRRLVAAMFEQARAHGVLPLKDPLEGIEVDIRLARALNAVSGPAPGWPASPTGTTPPPSSGS